MPQPVRVNFEVLVGGKYYPRASEVWCIVEGGNLFARVVDRKVVTPIDFTTIRNGSENHFTIDSLGTVLWCRWPEKTPMGNPVGVNLFDVIDQKDVEPVRGVLAKALRTGITLPIEYSFTIKGERRHKKGTVRISGSNRLYLVVHRIGGGEIIAFSKNPPAT